MYQRVKLQVIKILLSSFISSSMFEKLIFSVFYTGREAVSAITRAQSQMCKEHIVNVTCLSQQNLLYPNVLQSTCPHSYGFTGSPKSLGCFRDNKMSRLLPSYYSVFKNSNSPEQCAYLCLQSGFPYAGVQYS